MNSRIFLSIVLILMIMIVQQATCVTVKIDAKGEQCFFETVTKPDVKLQVQFQVSSGGFLDIDFRLLSPNGDLVHSIERETEGKFTFTAPTTGDYQICFSNSMSTLTPKIVSFDVHVGDLLDPHLTKIEHADPIVKSVLRLTEGLVEIQNEQKYLRIREHNHRDLAEQTNDKIWNWAIVEIIILVVMSVSQVLILKRFFKDDKRRMN